MEKSTFSWYFRFIVVSFVFSAFIPVALPQKVPIKFGEVDRADLEMTAYSKDTSAPAVVLCHHGYFSSGQLTFYEIIRIKILKKEGYSFANYTFPGTFQYVVKGLTINLENGRIIKEKVKSESIFENKITDGVYETRIAFPNVKVGSVIDLEFSYQGIPSKWRFQETVPVRYSELTIENSPLIKFKSNFFGYEPLAVSSPNHWIGRDIPAFKEEPFINSIENYTTKMELDLLKVMDRVYAATWEDVVSFLKGNQRFLFLYTTSPQVAEMVKRIRESTSSSEEMLKKAFEEAKTLKWNERSSLYTSNPTLNYVLKMKTGNSADVNSLLYELLRKLNFEVYPVAISTRENGILSQFSPSLEKFNNMLVLAKVGDKSYLLDATEQYTPYYLLPFRCLNSKGRIINQTRNEWIDLTSDKKERDVFIYDLKFDSDFRIKGSRSSEHYDYSALNFRKAYKKFNSQEEFLDNYKTDKTGLIIDGYEVQNLDSIYLPITEKLVFTASGMVTDSGDELILIPLLYDQLKENPFKSEVRKYPVDYGYARESKIVSKIQIPDNYVVKDLPPSSEIKLNDNSALFSYESKVSGKEIIITSYFRIDKPVFLFNEYGNLRNFYTQMIKKQSEPLVFKKE